MENRLDRTLQQLTYERRKIDPWLGHRVVVLGVVFFAAKNSRKNDARWPSVLSTETPLRFFTTSRESKFEQLAASDDLPARRSRKCIGGSVYLAAVDG